MAAPDLDREQGGGREPWPWAVGLALACLIGVCITFWWIAASHPDVELDAHGERPGLAPAGDDGSYFQGFPFAAGVRLGPENRLAVTIGGETREPALDRAWRPLAFSGSGDFEQAEVVFAGYGIVAPGAAGVPDYDSYGELEVAGKWVLALRFQPEAVPPEDHTHTSSKLPWVALDGARPAHRGERP